MWQALQLKHHAVLCFEVLFTAVAGALKLFKDLLAGFLYRAPHRPPAR